MTLQQQADAMLARYPLVVCDGWTKPRHERIVIAWGDPSNVSHGMCKECAEAWDATEKKSWWNARQPEGRALMKESKQ